MITIETVKGWHGRGVMHLDGEDWFENHFACNEEPRLTYIVRGPRSRYWGGKQPSRKLEQVFFVDGEQCADIDEAVRRLNREVGDGGGVGISDRGDVGGD